MVENCLRADVVVAIRSEARAVNAERGAARNLVGKGTRRFLLATVRTLRWSVDIVVNCKRRGEVRILQASKGELRLAMGIYLV